MRDRAQATAQGFLQRLPTTSRLQAGSSWRCSPIVQMLTAVAWRRARRRVRGRCVCESVSKAREGDSAAGDLMSPTSPAGEPCDEGRAMLHPVHDVWRGLDACPAGLSAGMMCPPCAWHGCFVVSLCEQLLQLQPSITLRIASGRVPPFAVTRCDRASSSLSGR